ncbi:MAG: hypothetical protein U0325_29000 [Polyangiales bacterium]
MFGGWSRDKCATLLAELAAVEGEPLVPRPLSDVARRASRAGIFIPWEHAAGLHAVRTVATRAHALG